MVPEMPEKQGESVPSGNGRRGVTIDMVAAAAGVSTATVSRVMSRSPLVADGTRRRVLETVAQLGYRPNSHARGLATGRSGVLGLLIADITNPFYPEIVRGVEQAAAAHGLSVLLYDTAEDTEREVQALQLMGERHVDGMIVCSSRLPEERIAALAQSDAPLVLVNRCLSDLASGVIDVDHEAGVRQAVTHLVELGHRRLGYVGGPEASQVQQRRLAAVRGVCRELGVVVPDGAVISTVPTLEGGEEVGQRLARRIVGREERPAPTAVLAYNDLVAAGIVRAAHAEGLHIPGQLSVIGHDDIPLAALLQPPLTTVRQPMRELGRQAVRVLTAQLAGEDHPARVRLSPMLVVRGSTAPPTP